MTQTIDTDLKLDDLELIKYLKQIKSPFIVTIEKIYNEVKDLLNNRIQTIFPKYTLHNTAHSMRIIRYMGNLVEDKSKLNEIELAMLVCSALLHDIGMAASEEDIEAIKNDKFSFCSTKFSAMKKLMGNNEEIALQEYIRRIHSSLSSKFIKDKLRSILTIPSFPNLDFADELALICESHTKDYDWIKLNLKTYEVRGDYHFNSQFIACILRLGDILDIDGNRTPYRLYELITPTGRSDEEWKQHFIISNNEKIIVNEKTLQKRIVFHGKSQNASIHRKILIYIDWVKTELTGSLMLVNGMNTQYSLFYDPVPEINIQAESYTFSDYKMTLQFDAISALLMGEKIYGSRSLGLRELIQNSIDACRIRQEHEQSTFEYGSEEYQPKIKVILDPSKDKVIIQDNGTGMTIDIVKKHFLNIGVSYYKSNDFLLKDFNYKPIGNYGIGFLSCFMLSDQVTVSTRYYTSKDKYKIDLEKGSEWTSLTHTEDVNFYGTEVVLNYRYFIGEFDNKPEKINEFLTKYFLTDGIDFKLITMPPTESTIEIKNHINQEPFIEKGLVKINLQDYLIDIEGYALIRKRGNFVREFEDIDFSSEIYSYDEQNGFVEVENFSSIQIDDYIYDTQIRFISIPLVSSSLEDDFLNGLRFTENDVDEVIEKLDHRLRWISIIIPKHLQSDFIIEGEIYTSDNIIGNLTFENLIELGHSKLCRTKVFSKSIKLFEGRKNALYLPYDDEKKPFWFYTDHKTRKELFIRSVLIKDFYFNIPILATILDVHTIVANIKSKNFIPDISRNNVNEDIKSVINYIIGVAIHKGAIDCIPQDKEEKATLKNFIETHYNNHKEFIK